ncbi:hypothetical protein [Glutamicibacter sp. AOP5-A2-18]|uniref:hypothetical protein n=1 Tax=Glutamicibacter sp. AOP5-A2-18 TaxID=3457656 RepID=UPI0040339677
MTTVDPTKINFQTQENDSSGSTDALRTGLFQPIEGLDRDMTRHPKISHTAPSAWTKIFGSNAEH